MCKGRSTLSLVKAETNEGPDDESGPSQEQNDAGD